MLYDARNSNSVLCDNLEGDKEWEVEASFKREGTYVYWWLIHVDVWQKQTQYCKAIILPLKINKLIKAIDICGLYYIEVGYHYANFLESFFFFLNHKWLLYFVESFLCIYWDDHMIFVFHFVNMVHHIDRLANVEESLHPWSKPHRSWCMNHFSSFHSYL